MADYFKVNTALELAKTWPSARPFERKEWMMTGNTINNYRKLKKTYKQSCSHEKELDQILNYLSSLPSLIRLVPCAIVYHVPPYSGHRLNSKSTKQ